MTRRSQALLTLALLAMASSLATAGPLVDLRYSTPVISELFFDPPGGDNSNYVEDPPGSGIFISRSWEYIELRGAPGTVLDDYYLISTEGENSTKAGNSPGNCDHVFDLSGMSIGTNGYMLILPKNFGRELHVAPGTSVYQNAGSMKGFGSNSGSTIGASDQGGDGTIENGGFGMMLVKHNGGFAPFVNLPMDPDGNAVIGDDMVVQADWDFIDSIGQLQPGEEDGGWGHAAVTFTNQPVTDTTHVAPGSVVVHTGIEPEHVFRAGTSRGNQPDDWFMTNVTDNNFKRYPNSYPYPDGVSWDFYAHYGPYGYFNSGDHEQPYDDGELYRGPVSDGSTQQAGIHTDVPEGAALMANLGRANFPIPDGDLNQDGIVDQADVDIVQANWGQSDPNYLGYWLFGDPSGDGTVGQEDLDIVTANLGKGPGAWTFTRDDLVWMEFTDPAITTLDALQLLPGDANGDGVVDVGDLGILAGSWQATAAEWANGDFTGDGNVDVGDLGVLAGHWGQEVGAGVPEPVSLSLLACGTLTVLRRRTR